MYPGHYLWLIRVGPAIEGEAPGPCGGAAHAMLGTGEPWRSMGERGEPVPIVTALSRLSGGSGWSKNHSAYIPLFLFM